MDIVSPALNTEDKHYIYTLSTQDLNRETTNLFVRANFSRTIFQDICIGKQKLLFKTIMHKYCRESLILCNITKRSYVILQ